MYDPTVFDNLKVAIENQVYDLDNLDQRIEIVNRIDRMEMSILSRAFAIQFVLAGRKDISAEIRLEVTLNDLATEILEMSGEQPGCSLLLRFYCDVQNIDTHCERIQDVLLDVWKPDLPPTQTISFVYGQQPVVYTNTIELRFLRKINEEQMEDIPDLIEHVLETLEALHTI